MTQGARGNEEVIEFFSNLHNQVQGFHLTQHCFEYFMQ
jgi:hypothetical protein